MMRQSLLGILLLCVCFAGCGYSTGSLLPSNFRTIYIESFPNKISFASEGHRPSYIPYLETTVRKAVSNRFLFDGHLRVADSDQANLILKGELIGYERDDVRLTDNSDVQEYRIRIIMSYTLVDGSTGETIWKEPSFAGEANYFLTGPQARSEEAAVNDAVADLARRTVERTVENW